MKKIDIPALKASLQAYLTKEKSATKILLPSEQSNNNNNNKNPEPTARPVAKHQQHTTLIALPQTATDVQALVRYCAAHADAIRFAVRTGGRDYSGDQDGRGRALLWIDMRDIDYVLLADDSDTARVGGGIPFRGLSTALAAEGLVSLKYFFFSPFFCLFWGEGGD